jgi:hypothetical protein
MSAALLTQGETIPPHLARLGDGILKKSRGNQMAHQLLGDE